MGKLHLCVDIDFDFWNHCYCTIRIYATAPQTRGMKMCCLYCTAWNKPCSLRCSIHICWIWQLGVTRKMKVFKWWRLRTRVEQMFCLFSIAKAFFKPHYWPYSFFWTFETFPLGSWSSKNHSGRGIGSLQETVTGKPRRALEVSSNASKCTRCGCGGEHW